MKDAADCLLIELNCSPLLCDEVTLLEEVGDTECLPQFDEDLLLCPDIGDKPCERVAVRSVREVWRLCGTSVEIPGRSICHPRNFGEAEFPRLAVTGDVHLLPMDEPVLILRDVGVKDL